MAKDAQREGSGELAVGGTPEGQNGGAALARDLVRRGFVIAGLGFLAACATTPARKVAAADPEEVPDGLWTSGEDLPPQRFARPVSPMPSSAGGAAGGSTPRPPAHAPADRPTIATQQGKTVGPEAKPKDLSNASIPKTYDGSVLRRALWTSWFPADREMDPLGKVKRITVHHEGNGAFTETSIAECKARLVNVLNGERGVGHRDIAYHFVIDPAGRVWEARDIRWEGRHTRNNHANNLGVMCLGNFEVQSIPPAQLASLERFVRDLQRKYGVGRKQVFTHQELSPTLCPGKDLQRKMGALRQRLPA
jgi:hypothetical protein